VDIYKKYVDVLFEKGYAYHCYCTEEELEAQRPAASESRTDAKISWQVQEFNRRAKKKI